VSVGGSILQRLASFRAPPWAYDAGLVALALAVLAASWGLYPGADEFTYFAWNDVRFGETCAFITVTGQPCPQCGMTRAFVHAARGNLLTSFWYSPAGLGLFLWSQVAGVLGAVRLVRRDPRAAAVPWQLTVGWVVVWTVGLYLVPYGLRLAGINVLP
jgi:hypothetical protein